MLDERTGQVILDLWATTTWDYTADVVGADGPLLTLRLNRLSSGAACTLVIDADARTFAMSETRPPLATHRLLRERLSLGGLTEAPAG